MLVGGGLLFAAGTVFEAWLFRYGPRSSFGRRVLRQQYTNTPLPMVVRGGVGALPVWIAVTGLAATMAFVGPAFVRWLFGPFLAVGVLAFILSYRVPPPFLPQFLRDEIAAGLIELQRPDAFDWLYLAIVLGALVVGTVLLLLVNLGFG